MSSTSTGHAQRDKNRDKMTPMPPSTFGKWVRARRRQLDLTQAGLGKRAGCSEAAIRKIEADERKPSRQLAELLAAALPVTVAETVLLCLSAACATDHLRITGRLRL
jgi:transcriptional regulator with XRE-family HTH domain